MQKKDWQGNNQITRWKSCRKCTRILMQTGRAIVFLCRPAKREGEEAAAVGLSPRSPFSPNFSPFLPPFYRGALARTACGFLISPKPQTPRKKQQLEQVRIKLVKQGSS
eukprot:GHVT01095949.1.p1 GENE.GHVT01095949.1~~GHVT01095949.1.p1  ORF type:complete len:109 (-),score=17.63 GHVT01095949.1:808-1134(-)